MKKRTLLRFSLWCCVLLVLGTLFWGGLRRLEQEQRREGREQLALAVRRAAVACYAAEGAYPAQLSHLQNHYGLVFDRERYAVLYESVGANLMPEITVVEP